MLGKTWFSYDMATLENVMMMKRQGMSERQIIDNLRQQGISPKEIMDALSQSKIKTMMNNSPQDDQNQFQPGVNDMQPSMMPPEAPQPTQEMNFEDGQRINSGYQPTTQPYAEYPQQNYPDQMQMQQPQQGYQDPNQMQQQYPEYYQQYQQQPTDFQAITEIAEQIADEKSTELKKQISSLSRFKEDTSLELEKINQRLQKIEDAFNNLQMAVIRKVGDYGEDIKNISREMHMNQQAFSKMLNPILDNTRENKSQRQMQQQEQEESEAQDSGIVEKEDLTQEPQERKTRGKKKSGSDFEAYLR